MPAPIRFLGPTDQNLRGSQTFGFFFPREVLTMMSAVPDGEGSAPTDTLVFSTFLSCPKILILFSHFSSFWCHLPIGITDSRRKVPFCQYSHDHFFNFSNFPKKSSFFDFFDSRKARKKRVQKFHIRGENDFSKKPKNSWKKSKIRYTKRHGSFLVSPGKVLVLKRCMPAPTVFGPYGPKPAPFWGLRPRVPGFARDGS